MTWLISKNPIKLALVVLMWNLIIGLIISIIQALAGVNSASAVAGFVALYIVGAGYTQKFHVVMEKETAHKTAGYFSIIQYVLAFIFYFLTKIDIPLIVWLLIITAITALLYFAVRWILVFAGKNILKYEDTKKNKKVKS